MKQFEFSGQKFNGPISNYATSKETIRTRQSLKMLEYLSYLTEISHHSHVFHTYHVFSKQDDRRHSDWMRGEDSVEQLSKETIEVGQNVSAPTIQPII